jgi:hypothetical protein
VREDLAEPLGGDRGGAALPRRQGKVDAHPERGAELQRDLRLRGAELAAEIAVGGGRDGPHGGQALLRRRAAVRAR